MNIDYKKAWTQIELTDFCNLSCIMCEQGGEVSWNTRAARVHGRKKGFIDHGLFKKILQDFKHLGRFYEISPFWLGEATVHPQFAELMEELCRTGSEAFEVFQLHSNLNVLDEDSLMAIKKLFASFNRSKFVISIDAATPETYDRIRRGGNLQAVVSNARKIIELKKTLDREIKITVQFIVMEQNCREVRLFHDLWSSVFRSSGLEFNVVSSFDSFQLHDFSNPVSNYIYYEVLNTHSSEKQKNFDLYLKHVRDVIPGLGQEMPEQTEKPDSEQGKSTPEVQTVMLTDRELKKLSALVLSMIEDPSEGTVKELVPYLKKAFDSGNFVCPCASIFYSPYISSNGDLTICCLDNRLDLCYGNLRQSSLSELWEGSAINRVRLMHIAQEFKHVPRCQICVSRGQRSQNRKDFTISFHETVAYLNGLCT